MKAIVLAAGKGRRLLSEQFDMPKVMRLVNGKPLLEYVLENLNFINQDDTIIVVGYKKESIVNAINGNYKFALQEEQLGTGHAVKAAKSFFDAGQSGNVLVCYGDMPLFTKETYTGIAQRHIDTGADCTVLTAISDAPLAYGRIIRKDGKFAGVIEQKDCCDAQLKINELNVGVYVFKSDLMFEYLDKLKNNNVQGEYYLTDLPKLLLEAGKKVETFSIDNENEIYGVNTSDELKHCEEILQGELKSEQYSIRFGTGGWREIIGDKFIKTNIQLIAQSVADDMKAKGYNKDGVVIGYDKRFLSDKGAVWAAEVFAANGVKVYYVNHVAPTPLIMYTVKTLKTKYGMAVTASHNPSDYNGIKIFTAGGKDADKSVTNTFEEIIHSGVKVKHMSFEEATARGRIIETDFINEYMDSIIHMINMDAIRKKKLKILIDPMYGVSKMTLQTILMTARCDVDIIHGGHDALFGGRMPSPSADTLIELRNRVVEQGYSLGIGTDGDADRIGIIDNKGKFIHPNEIMALLYYYLLKFKGWKGDVVRNIATTHVLDKIAEDFNQQCFEVPVGFKFISSKMEEVDALIGGESSGGLTIRGHIRGKDGIFAAALLVEMISVTGKSMSEILTEIYEKYGYVAMNEYDVRFSHAKKEELMNVLFERKLLPEFGIEIDKVSYLDGVKVYFKNGGWIIARFSGTEPVIRIFCEMETIDKADKISKQLREFLQV